MLPSMAPPHGSGRLTADDWIQAGFAVLVDSGPNALRIEPLCERLHVTKGSFYWHFRDRDALHAAMLERWRADTTKNAIELVEAESVDKGDRLTRLIGLATKNTWVARLDIAIRAWAKTDTRAAAAVAAIDRIRMDYIATLLGDLGFAPHTARLRARILYLALIGGFFTEGGGKSVPDAALWEEAERLIVRA